MLEIFYIGGEEMTAKELSQVYFTNKEIKRIQLKLAELKQKNFYKLNFITGMPKDGNSEEMNAEYMNSCIELEKELEYNLIKLQRELSEAERYLGSIDDAEIRLIVRLRIVNNMNWDDIGWEMSYDRRTVSRKFYKYFSKE